MAVYFMRAGIDGPVKIGHTVDIERRLAFHQTSSAERVCIINQIDGGRDLERWLHWRFKGQHLRGEWFNFDNAMLTVQSEIEGVDLAIPEDAPVVKPSRVASPAILDLKAAIGAYGNLLAVAKRLNLTHSTVYSWKYKGGVPHWRQAQLAEAMRQDGLA